MAGEAWTELVEAVAPAGGPAGEALMSALARLGLTPEERADLAEVGERRTDATGVALDRLARMARDVSPRPLPDGAGPAATDLALRHAERLRALHGATLAAEVGSMPTEELAPLPAATAGDLVRHLVEQAEAAGGTDRSTLADALTGLAPVIDPSGMPVEALVRIATATPDLAETVAVVLAGAPTDLILRGLAEAVRSGRDPVAVADLLTMVAQVREAQEQVTSAPPPGDLESAPPPGDLESAPPPGDLESVPTSPPPMAPPPPLPMAPPPPSAGSPPAPGGDGPPDLPDGDVPAGRPAHPRLDLATGTTRPEVVVVDRPFTVTVGLAARPSAGLVRTGPVRVDTGRLDVVLVFDPASLVATGPTRHSLEVTADDPYPTVDVTFTAQWLERAPATRRIGVHYLAQGQLVGVAWRSFVAVDDEASVAGAVVPRPRDAELLDLSPLLGVEPPDLVLGVVASERGADTWVWTAYSGKDDLPVPDAPNAATIGPDTVAFALDTRRGIQFSTDRLSDYLDLAGRAHRIGAAVPQGVADTIRALVTEAGRTTAPTVLLLTEELVVPWEIAHLGLSTPWGGTSPFLGAHVAVSRWPLTDRVPRPVPRAEVTVEHGAVVTADYTGVAGVGVLEAATAEADRVAGLFTPAAHRVEPSLPAVVALLRGTPPADVVHVALHGMFDATGNQEGIVLVRREGDAAPTKLFLTPIQVENGRLDRGPFVFLNACQVGADKEVLGSYGGFAATLLRIGAGAVLAPLWNVDDDVAATVADEVYAHALTADEPLPVAEVIRRIRARYTEEAVGAGTAGVTATLVAFQLLAHPRLRLTRAGG